MGEDKANPAFPRSPWTSVTCAGIKTEYQEAIALLDSLPKRRAEFIDPMDCASVSRLPDGPQWLFEIKLDGYRASQFDKTRTRGDTRAPP